MKAKVYFEDGFLYTVAAESIDETEANEITDKQLSLIRDENNNEPALLIINLEKLKSISSEARKVFAKASAMKELKRIAFVGGSIFIRTVTNFIVRIVNRDKKVKYFGIHEEAKKWLLEEK